MRDLLIVKRVVNDLYELIAHNKSYSDYRELDPSDEFTSQADHDRRFRAWVLISHLVNDLHNMGLFSNDERLTILDLLDKTITKGKN